MPRLSEPVEGPHAPRGQGAFAYAGTTCREWVLAGLMSVAGFETSAGRIWFWNSLFTVTLVRITDSGF